MELKFQPVIFVLVNVYVQREVPAKTKKVRGCKYKTNLLYHHAKNFFDPISSFAGRGY